MTRVTLQRVELKSAPIEPFEDILGDSAYADFQDAMDRFAHTMRGRTVWNVNSTGRGGGVAELLGSLIPYDIGAGVDERWIVIEGSPEFFAVTKKIHSLLHGVAPDGTELTAADRDVYEQAMAPNATSLLAQIRPDDVAVLHDPQTAGLVPALAQRGIRVVWRCHIGVDHPNAVARGAWRFLSPYLLPAAAIVYSREAYVWAGLSRSRVRIVAPCIDPFSSKNRHLDEAEIQTILDRSRAIEQVPPSHRFVLQVARWDRLKDPAGVLRMFAAYVAPRTDAWLVLAGPQVTSVDDDPEQPKVLADVMAVLAGIDPRVHDRVVVAQIPLADIDQNALIVNALQRRADVVVQKSIAEGFGLTVAEAMWKSRPMVGSRVGGIEDQIQDGKSGLLIDDPNNLEVFGDAVVGLLSDPERAAELGRQAHLRVVHEYLAPRHLMQQAELIAGLL